ncbi:MAG: type II toxin-antitoxin system MqsA family antitoxin [Rubrivivax sp.]
METACANCGSDKVHLKQVTRSFGAGSDLLVVERIPMWSCPACGESYFTARTMHELERIKALRKSVSKTRSVAVAQYEPTEA